MTGLEELEIYSGLSPFYLDDEWMSSLEFLKTLKIWGWRVLNATSQFEHMKKMTGLKKMIIQLCYFQSNSFLYILNSLGEMKYLQNIHIQIDNCLENGWD